jgi:hypothetical protein
MDPFNAPKRLFRSQPKYTNGILVVVQILVAGKLSWFPKVGLAWLSNIPNHHQDSARALTRFGFYQSYADLESLWSPEVEFEKLDLCSRPFPTSPWI